MQKLITVTLLLDKLQEQARKTNEQGAALVNELPEIDALLEAGWQIEEYKVIYTDTVKGTLLLSVLLEDGADPDDPMYEFDEDDLE